MPNQPLLVIKSLTKLYPGVCALDGVNMEIMPGEIHALVGENGAGKSTVIKCITGAIQSTCGDIWFAGEKLEKITPSMALAKGISTIYQEFNLVPYMSVAENIMLGRFPATSGLIDNKKIEQLAKNVMDELGVPIDVTQKVQALTVGYQQLVEIAKSVSRDAKLIIMDEPSAALTTNELKYFFQIIRKLQAKGIAILYVSHRLEEIFELCERVTIFRDGQYVDTLRVADTNQQQLIRLMVNRELSNIYPHQPLPRGQKALEVKKLNTPLLKDISFEVYEGEILGFSGLVGAGRTEIMRAIFGADTATSAEMTLYGRPYHPKSPKWAIKNGIGLITEDRKQQGLLLELPIMDNVVVANLDGVSHGGIVSDKAVNQATHELCSRLKVKAPNYKQKVKNLSGGNQQKVVLAKWMFCNCNVIIFDEPTRGIDVGAKHEIYLLMDELAKQGKAIIMISSEMPEMLGMADRIIVMHEGKMMGELDKEEANQERILALASGIVG